MHLKQVNIFYLSYYSFEAELYSLICHVLLLNAIIIQEYTYMFQFINVLFIQKQSNTGNTTKRHSFRILRIENWK